MSDGEPDAEAEPEAEPVELPPWSVAVVVVNGDPGDGSTEPLLDAAMGGFAEAEAVVRVDRAGVPGTVRPHSPPSNPRHCSTFMLVLLHDHFIAMAKISDSFQCEVLVIIRSTQLSAQPRRCFQPQLKEPRSCLQFSCTESPPALPLRPQRVSPCPEASSSLS